MIFPPTRQATFTMGRFSFRHCCLFAELLHCPITRNRDRYSFAGSTRNECPARVNIVRRGSPRCLRDNSISCHFASTCVLFATSSHVHWDSQGMDQPSSFHGSAFDNLPAIDIVWNWTPCDCGHFSSHESSECG